jgi:chromosome segregation ATPase
LRLDYCISKQYKQGASVDPSDIENTDDWLGCPTPLETCRHQLALYENEFEELNLQLRQARERIFKLVEMNDELSDGKAKAEAGLKKSAAEISRLQSERGELLGQVNSLLRVSDQRDHLFRENQRLLSDARDRES